MVARLGECGGSEACDGIIITIEIELEYFLCPKLKIIVKREI